jgi:HD superfamily phosphohydrolase
VHTRLEHSIGAVHVAQLIVDHVNQNFRSSPDAQPGDWRIAEIDSDLARFIRLGALLHDVGHLPFGHTLEDELNHLRAHDGAVRLAKIGDRKFLHYDLDKSVSEFPKPTDGWSLRELVNALYQPFCNALGANLEPFLLLCMIICKPPRDLDGRVRWDQTCTGLDRKISLQLSRDIVGNTICADFLDYLFRDWHHLGKTLYEDTRIYQYMEARTKIDLSSQGMVSTFVINVGAGEKIRHDALTNILELLEGRYKLAETVLFHRTKLAITALLDRCLLEIRELYGQAGITVDDFADAAEDLLLEGSDDALPDILLRLADGGTESGKEKLKEKIRSDQSQIANAIHEATDLLTTSPATDDAITTKTQIERDLDLIALLINRLRDRCVYTLAYKLRISDFTGAHTPSNPRLKVLIDLYRAPENRHAFLRGMEARCNLSVGSLIMYCPPSAAMNAKIAKVNLLVEGEVVPFDEYDNEDSNLTRGALWAQIHRFYELWSAQVYIDRATWDSLSLTGQQNLRATLKEFFFQMRPDTDVAIVRAQVEASIRAVLGERPMAARAGSVAPELDRFTDFVFPSGLKF